MSHNLLSLPLKTSPPLPTLTAALVRHISHSYNTHPSAFETDISQFQRLRNDWANGVDVHTSSVDLGIRYYAQLVWLTGKMARDIGISFPWTISFPSSLPILASLGPSISPSPSPSPPSSPSNSRPSSPSSPESKIQSRPYATTTAQANRTIIAQPDLNYEIANVLWGLAALYSHLGVAEDRKEGESIKRAVKAFQISAGILSFILSQYTPELSVLPPPKSPDLETAMLESLRDAMLAQAMECFWQKGVLDNLKDSTIAKLAMRVSELYQDSLDSAAKAKGAAGGKGGIWGGGKGSSSVACELPSEWVNHMHFKRWHFAAASQYRKSMDDLGANRYGDELGRLKLAESHIKRALEGSKRGVSSLIISDLESLKKVIETNLVRANKDNDLIYLEPITSASNLTPVVGADMVKAMLPNEIENPIPLLRSRPPPALGEPLFQELVPYAVHVSISIYDDRKDQFVRERIAEKLNELDGIAASTLQSLNLPGSLQALEQPMNLPSSLLNRSAEVHSSGGLRRLYSLLKDIEKISDSDSKVLQETTCILDQESVEDSEVRSRFPSQIWAAREASSTANAEMRDKIREYQTTMKLAQDSDSIVKNKLKDWEKSIQILDQGEEVLSNFVPLGHRDQSFNRENEKQELAVRALRSCLEDLEDLLSSRNQILNQAKDLARNDDVRPRILKEATNITTSYSSSAASGNGNGNPRRVVLQPQDFEHVFEEEMQKYKRFEIEVEDSENEQEALLEEIRERNDAFTEARKVDPIVRRREEALQTLDLAFTKFREITSNLEEGLKFYNSLARILHDFRQEVKEWHRARTIDIQQLTSQFSSSNSNSNSNSSSNSNFSSDPTVEAQAPAPSPARNTRARSKAQKQPEPKAGNQPQTRPPEQQQQQPQQPPPPQWGAWKGGNIQFGD